MSSKVARRRRIIQLIISIAAITFFVLISRLEVRLFQLAELLAQERNFIATVIYFGSINLNVVIVLLLSLLILRNLAKLFLERKRGVFGSRLRTKISMVLVIFTIAPSAILFYVSTSFVSKSFDSWVNNRLKTLIRETQNTSLKIFSQDQKRLESIARSAATKIECQDELFTTPTCNLQSLHSLGQDYNLYKTVFFRPDGTISYTSKTDSIDIGYSEVEFVQEIIPYFTGSDPSDSFSTIESQPDLDSAAALIPVYSKTGQLGGVLLLREKFESGILRNIENTLTGIANLKPASQTVKLGFFVLLAMMILLIVFAAIWLALGIARGITQPLRSLAEATVKVAAGDYSFFLTPQSEDETGSLVRSFNKMVTDLRQHRDLVEHSRLKLEITNHELEGRNQFIEVIMQNVSAGVIAFDATESITLINIEAQNILKIPEATYVGKTLSQLFSQGSLKKLRELWRTDPSSPSALKNSAKEISIEVATVTLNLIVRITHLRGMSDQDFGKIMVFEDATEKLQFQRMVAWKEVAQRIAHEIKNPVTPIRLNAERLQKKYSGRFVNEDKEIFDKCLTSILNQVDSLKDLVNAFANFSKLPSANFVTLDISKLLMQSLETLGLLESQIDIKICKGEALVLGDKEQLLRVFLNVLSNSLEAFKQATANNKSGNLKITVETKIISEKNRVTILFADNGPGIPQNLLSRIIEPYFSTKVHGTGLGLAIVDQIIMEHKGRLEIKNNAQGGACVVIELPLV